MPHPTRPLPFVLLLLPVVLSAGTPRFTIAWPTGEFGGMGLEGAVKLGYRNELAAIEVLPHKMKDTKTNSEFFEAMKR